MPTAPRLCFLLLIACAFVACGQGPDHSSQEKNVALPSTGDILRRERAVVFFGQADAGRARAEMAPLAQRKIPSPDDLLIAAQIELLDMDLITCRKWLDRWAELEPASPRLAYLRARLAHLEGAFDERVGFLEAALAGAPGDLGATYSLAGAMQDRDFESDEAWEVAAREALTLYDRIETLGLENGTIWYVSTIYRQFLLAADLGEDERMDHYKTIWNALVQQGAKPISDQGLNEGSLARVIAPRPLGQGPSAQAQVPPFAVSMDILPDWTGAQSLGVHDLNGDRRPDLVAAGEMGLRVALGQEDGTFAQQVLRSETTAGFAALDLNKDDDWDLVWWNESQVGIIEQDEGAFVPTPVALPTAGANVRHVSLVDHDHDGDLDLLLATDSGPRLWRNDGAGEVPDDPELPRGSFVDVTAEANLPTDWPCHWCAVEDLDGDQDVDLVFGGPKGIWIASNLRGGNFVNIASAVFAAQSPPAGHAGLLADWNADGRVDLIVANEEGSSLWLGQGDQTLLRTGDLPPIPAGSQPRETDLDLDGYADLVWGAAQPMGLLAVGHDMAAEFSLGTDPGSGLAVASDLDFSLDPDLAMELISLNASGVHIWRTEDRSGHGIRLRWIGQKDNRQGIGAVIELRAKERYRRVYWKGDTEVLGIGPAEWADVVRVLWPNGVSNNHLNLERGDMTILSEDFGVQPEGLIGSCPFLYTWNGETYTFISDVLGITPLGLPMAPGMIVPPDHDEYVLVRGDQLKPKDGILELQFTEELREVTYLDAVHLEAIDHPADIEVFPNERFSFPPFPETHLHTIQGALAPTSAIGSDGKDWTAELAQEDSVHAQHFKTYRGQYLGLAEPHFLELTFDKEAVQNAKQLRLLCTGWFYWTDASVNMAAGRTPGLGFTPPMLMVPGPDGTWVPTGPPVGFPAGKTKTMVIDVSQILNPEDPRLRIFSSITLYWDRIALAVCGDDAPRVITALAPTSARLWKRGFSAPLESGRDDLPERFEWETLADLPRWDQHPGRYTKLGESLPLVQTIDDQFCVLGSGDCLTLQFDASALPPLPEGWTRDYQVFFDGWAKDRDPNTIEALTVEPLPFHGMSGYPYGEDEHFPNTPAHQKWRDEWQTRQGKKLLAPIAPALFDAWVPGKGY